MIIGRSGGGCVEQRGADLWATFPSTDTAVDAARAARRATLGSGLSIAVHSAPAVPMVDGARDVAARVPRGGQPGSDPPQRTGASRRSATARGTGRLRRPPARRADRPGPPVRLVEEWALGTTRPPRACRLRLGELPVATGPLVGRQGEQDEVEGLVATTRLVTLTGVGGIGKTDGHRGGPAVRAADARRGVAGSVGDLSIGRRRRHDAAGRRGHRCRGRGGARQRCARRRAAPPRSARRGRQLRTRARRRRRDRHQGAGDLWRRTRPGDVARPARAGGRARASCATAGHGCRGRGGAPVRRAGLGRGGGPRPGARFGTSSPPSAGAWTGSPWPSNWLRRDVGRCDPSIC